MAIFDSKCIDLSTYWAYTIVCKKKSENIEERTKEFLKGRKKTKICSDNERVYFRVPFCDKRFVRKRRCDFDPIRKLWYTDVANTYLAELVVRYGVDGTTSDFVLGTLWGLGII